MIQRNVDTDISATGGVALCAVVVLTYWYLEAGMPDQLIELLAKFASEQQALIILTLLSMVINLSWVGAMVKRITGLRRQGSRLRTITGKEFPKVKAVTGRAAIAFLIAALVFAFLTAISDSGNDVNIDGIAIWTMLSLNWSTSVFILIMILSRTLGTKLSTIFQNRRLTRFPLEKDRVVLGAVFEDDSTQRPHWKIIGKRGLNGNILITGSIGSGKTASAVLPLLEQALRNFDPPPSMLALDPKGSMAKEIKAIADKIGVAHKIVHLQLDGNATINPVWEPNLLSNAGFIRKANMVRTAAANFLGKSTDNPFWSLQAFNLMKNTLCYCAATHAYFTLTEFYTAMTQAGSAFQETLERALDEKEWSDEERFNIEQASNYFGGEFAEMDDRLKSNILASATVFLNQFQEYSAARIFCPAINDLTIPSIDQLVDNGTLVIFDVQAPGLSRSMGTFVKLMFQESVLSRIGNEKRSSDRSFILLIDEYQDVATSGFGALLGDDRFLAKGREANAITIAATQGQSSLLNSIGSEPAVKELIQNFRTRLFFHTTDLYTARTYQELMGKTEKRRVTQSVTESSQNAKRNLAFGGFDANRANIMESVSESAFEEFAISASELARLNTFEAFAHVYDGVRTTFDKIFFKPYFLKKRNLPHQRILQLLTPAIAVTALFLGTDNSAVAFPNVCTVVGTPAAEKCMSMTIEPSICKWPFPRPCARISYYVPSTFIEVVPHPGQSYFKSFPGAALQLQTVSTTLAPHGMSEEDSHFFHAHAIAVPFDTVFAAMACGGIRLEKTCFDAMSEHVWEHWMTGSGDRFEPSFLAWAGAPAACINKGTATSIIGQPEISTGTDLTCSVPLPFLSIFPPSAHSVCNGWGVFFPRSGWVEGPSRVGAALMVASRLKSIAHEVFQSTPSGYDEKWQMIYPKSSDCFREGQNIGILEGIKGVHELTHAPKGRSDFEGYLFTIWKKTSCTVDLPIAFIAKGANIAIKAACKALGEL